VFQFQEFKMHPRTIAHASCALFALATTAARADETDTIVVTGEAVRRIENVPTTTVTIDAARIATTVNAVSAEDTLKYAPSLIIRKRSIGDNFAPIATRTSGLGSSARSLIYADGMQRRLCRHLSGLRQILRRRPARDASSEPPAGTRAWHR